MKRRLFLQINGIAVAAAAAGLTACGDESTSAGGTGGAGGDYTIAVVPKDSTNPWFVRMEVGVKKYASDTGLNVFQKGPPPPMRPSRPRSSVTSSPRRSAPCVSSPSTRGPSNPSSRRPWTPASSS